MFSGNTNLSSYCLHYFTVSSYSYYVTLKSSLPDDWISDEFSRWTKLETNAEIYASYHRRRERQPSPHICKFTICGTEPKNTLSRTYIRKFPLRILAQFRSTLQLAVTKKPAKSSAIWHVWNVRLKAVNITTTVSRMWRPTVWQIGSHCFHLEGRSLVYWIRATVGYPKG